MRQPDDMSEYTAPARKTGTADIFESRRDRARAKDALDLFKRNYREEEILIRLFGKVTPYRLDWLNRHLKEARLIP